MTQRHLRFAIGLFVLVGFVTLGTLIYIFSGQPRWLRQLNHYTVILPEAPGVSVGTPVQRSGVRIGEVESIQLDSDTGDVRVGIGLDRNYQLRKNEVPTLTHGLLGDATIELVAKKPDSGPVDRTPVEPGSDLVGTSQGDTRQLVAQGTEVLPALNETLAEFRKLAQGYTGMSPQVEQAIGDYRQLAKTATEAVTEFRRTNEDFRTTAQTYTKLGNQLNTLLQDNQKRLPSTLENLNDAAARLAATLSDENQRNLSSGLKNLNTAVGQLDAAARAGETFFKDGQQVFQRASTTIENIDGTFALANKVLLPLADSSERLVENLDTALCSLSRTLTTLDALVHAAAERDGTLYRLITDPSLFNNLNEAACIAARILPRLDPITRDLAVFADKLARHPELIGIGGVVRPGYGIK